MEEFEVTDRTRIFNKVASRRNISVKDIITVGRRSTIVQDNAIVTDSKPKLNSVSHQRDTDAATVDNQLSKFDEQFHRTPMFTKRELKEFKKYMYTAKRKEVIGMYLTKNILLENDNFFAQSGELVTHKMVDDAEQLGLLEQILKHASPLPPAISYQIRYLITQSL